MEGFLKRFTSTDFLGFLFPGAMALAAVIVSFKLTPWGNLLSLREVGFAEGVLLLVSSYAVGAVLSGFSWLVYNLAVKAHPRWRSAGDPRSKVIPERFAVEVGRALEEITGISCEVWSTEHFYLARSLVDSRMERQSILIARQNALRTLRQYMLMPLLLWGWVGFFWARSIPLDDAGWNLLIMLVLLLATLAALLVTIGRLRRNREREAREVCLALLAGHALGLFAHARVVRSR